MFLEHIQFYLGQMEFFKDLRVISGLCPRFSNPLFERGKIF
jgi:hypothetical protein